MFRVGVFNAKGVLLCFGNAKLNLRPLPPQSPRVDLPEPVNKGPPTFDGSYNNSLQEDKFGSEFSLTSKSLANSRLGCCMEILILLVSSSFYSTCSSVRLCHSAHLY